METPVIEKGGANIGIGGVAFGFTPDAGGTDGIHHQCRDAAGRYVGDQCILQRGL